MADYKETIARLRADKKKLQADLKAARATGASKQTKEGLKRGKQMTKAGIKEVQARRQADRALTKAKRQADRASTKTRRQSR